MTAFFVILSNPRLDLVSFNLELGILMKRGVEHQDLFDIGKSFLPAEKRVLLFCTIKGAQSKSAGRRKVIEYEACTTRDERACNRRLIVMVIKVGHWRDVQEQQYPLAWRRRGNVKGWRSGGLERIRNHEISVS